ncbi:hypothetical protein GCM10027053_24500 [Intrasporangium mesophilum]
MYDYARSGLQATLAARQQAQSAAHQTVLTAQGTVSTANNNLAAANNVLNVARAGVPPAQSNLTAAQANAAQAAQTAANAQAAVVAWEAQMPDPYIGGETPFAPNLPLSGSAERDPSRALPGGGYPRPNPAYATWLQQYNVLKAARDSANAALATANNNVAAAQSALNSANNQVTAAQNAVTARTQELAAANAQLTSAQNAESAAAAAVTAVQAQIAALDARAARFVAVPLDRTGITALADEEQAEVSRLRPLRATARANRLTANTTRATLLAAHDASIASLVPLSTALRSWVDATYPDPPNVATMLDAVVASATGQAASNPRNDDLAALTSQAQAALTRLQTTVDAAVRDRDAKYQTLQAARDAVASVVADQP